MQGNPAHRESWRLLDMGRSLQNDGEGLLTAESSMGRLKITHGVLINQRSLMTSVKSVSEEGCWLKAHYVVFRRQSREIVNLVLQEVWMWGENSHNLKMTQNLGMVIMVFGCVFF